MKGHFPVYMDVFECLFKRYLRQVCFCIGLVLLVSCTIQEKKEPTIGFSQCAGGDWREKMNKEMQSEVRFYPGVGLEIRNANGNLQTQLEDIHYFIEKRVDLLIISPLEDEQMAEAFNSIDFKGIPILLIDRNISSNKSVAFVGASNLEIGRRAAQYVLKKYGEQPTKVIHIQGYDKSTATIERENGFVNELSKYPNFSIQILTSGKDLDGKNIDKTKEIIKNNIYALRQADVVYAFNDEIALAVHDELIRTKSKQHPLLIGIDGMIGYGKGINGVKDNRLTASIVYPQGGAEAIDIGMKILNNVSVPKETLLPVILIDKNNIDAYYYKSLQQIEQQQKIDLLCAKNLSLLEEKEDAKKKNMFIIFVLLIVLTVITVFLLREKLWLKISLMWKMEKSVNVSAASVMVAEEPYITENDADGKMPNEEEIRRKLKEIIDERYTEESFEINDLIKDFALSRVQFYQMFRRLFHDTPNNYVRKRRLEKSKELILADKYTYAEITYKVGFSSPAYFSKCFKDEYNCTPSEFFEQHKK